MVKFYKNNPPNSRLALDRYDFNNHIDGYDFRQNATTIDLFPTLIIDGYPQTNVQSAIEKLNSIVTPPPLPDATTTVKGIVKLAGDIAGTAINVTVKGLQTYPVSSVPPTNGQALIYNSGSASWEAQSIANFVAGGDLAGTNTSQQVVSLTGSIGVVNISAATLVFDQSLSTVALIQADKTSAGNCGTLFIGGQNVTTIGFDSGPVIITGGLHASGGISPGVIIGSNETKLLLHATEVAANRNILGLLGTVDSSSMPASTGDRVIYIKNAVTAPTSGNPVAGTILYSTSGALRIKRESGKDFLIGNYLDNPFTWSDAEPLSSNNNYVVSKRSRLVYTAGSGPQLMESIPINATSSNVICKVDVIIVAKQIGTAEGMSLNLSITGIKSGAPAATYVGVGTPTYSDIRTTAAAASWALPTIILAANNLELYSGTSGTDNINWFANIQYNFNTD